ncbi:hypothetical protein KAR91_75850 [Candidatus Pacearchaeota archaeon]|nr:hypothetical protein [Candidatus Pacearchaeota archaeon]
MPTYTLSDGTTTITFKAFPEINRRTEAVNSNPISYPDNEGYEVIHVGQWRRVFIITWRLQDASPTAGTAAAKRDALEDLILSGGVNEGLFTLTFDREDSQEGAPVLATYDGKVVLNQQRMLGGDHVSEIEGEFEFWEDTIN